jgi:hypothetical protein
MRSSLFLLFVLIYGGCVLFQPSSFAQAGAVSKQAQLKQLDQLHQLHLEEEQALSHSVALSYSAALPEGISVQASYIANHIKEEKIHVTSLQVGNSSLRLQESGATKNELDAFRAASTGATNTGDLHDLAKAGDMMTDLALKYNVESLVPINTSNVGAAIKYQSFGERLRNEPAHTVNGLTNTKTRLAIGIYYFWAERKGLATSSKDAYYTLKDKESDPIVLDEQ